MPTKIFITKSPIGVFAFSGDGNLMYYELYPKNPKKVAKFLEGETSPNFLNKLKKYEIIENEVGIKFIRSNLREYAISLGFVKNEKELNEFLNELGILISKSRMKLSMGLDKIIIQASNALDDLRKTKNLLYERLREWFGHHYPEFDRNNPKLVDMILEFGKRENFPNFKDSTGIDLADDDIKSLQNFARIIKYLDNEIKELEKYVKRKIKEVAPNFSSLIDPLLAAKILSLAGSLEKLAKMPASTIQLIGSEKALFRHLRAKARGKKDKSPKYGILFNSKYIQNAPADKRGKIARILASKLMIAARIDFYSKRYEPKLKEELEMEIKKVLAK